MNPQIKWVGWFDWCCCVRKKSISETPIRVTTVNDESQCIYIYIYINMCVCGTSKINTTIRRLNSFTINFN